MTKRLLCLATLPALALAACGDSTTTATNDTVVMDEGLGNAGMANDAMMMNDAGMANAAAPTAMLTPAQFVETVAASDMFEIESGKIAQSKATSAGLKDYAAQMVTDHTNSTAELKAAADRDDVTAGAGAMTAEQRANLDALRAASGAAFDEAYKTQQIAAHQKALDVLRGYNVTGTAPQLKQFAAKTAPIVQGHLQMVQGM